MSNLSAEEKKIIETFVKVLPLLEEIELHSAVHMDNGNMPVTNSC
ncbi:hypothetical protein [Ruminiclostridium papyrosolvens]|uniref:Uncharacterized protein n=1 Tax=Ruminiclostridium papyrosolvens C7 TaxID=1330534 RepID=U4R0R7_9FIRM|nr:hypothetical protein [Ruminiclostridium papyrosolvens]EPR10258.1 hypothetical protein L323_14165 [Ruminiclostridium papyrosolvens C7]